MPKDSKNGRSARRQNRSCPLMPLGKGREGDKDNEQNVKDDWEDAICPICLESPHNAVLLICSSHADGCRAYMCNTSHRQSNCLDQYQKTQATIPSLRNPRQEIISEHRDHSAVDSLQASDGFHVRVVGNHHIAPYRRPLRRPRTNLFEQDFGDSDGGYMFFQALNSRISSASFDVVSRRSRRNARMPHLVRNETQDAVAEFLGLERSAEVDDLDVSSYVEEHGTRAYRKTKHLMCPLCRGQIFGWRINNAARKYFNGKARSCSHESCTFTGTYQELRVHARCEHPCTQPCDIDPVRQRDWIRLEHQREIGDVLSTLGGDLNEDMNGEDWGSWPTSFLFRDIVDEVDRIWYEAERNSRDDEGVSLDTDDLNTSSNARARGRGVTNSTQGLVRRQLRPRGT